MRELVFKFEGFHINKRGLLFGILFILISLIATGCGSESSETHAYQLAPLEDMHPYVQNSPDTVQQAYQFAHAHPDKGEGF